MELFGIQFSIWVFWYSLAIILLIVEFFTAGILAIFFAFAAFITGIVSFISDNWLLQLGVFITVSFLGIIFGRNTLEQWFKVNKEIRPSTIDALIGKKGIVIKDVTITEKGLVKIDGEIWTAKTDEDVNFLAGDRVIIAKIEGVTVIIKKLKEGNE